MSSYHKWRTAAAVILCQAALGGASLASAQSVSMATWGGGVGDTWRNAFAGPFQNESGTKVNITEVPNPEAQVRTQAKAPQYNAVLVGYFEAARLYRDGLLETFSDSEIPQLADTPEQYKMRAADGKLIGAPVYFTYYGIAFNTDYVKPSEMQSWSDLGNPKWKGQIAVTQPIYSSTYHLTILSHAMGGDEKDISASIPMFKKQVANASVVYTSLAQLNQLLTRGEVVAAPYYLARIWAMKRDGVKNVDISLPKEGGLMLPYMVVV
ncbi:MAG TPA: extracellular solute-binding protein, partial [Bordetella sp.]